MEANRAPVRGVTPSDTTRITFLNSKEEEGGAPSGFLMDMFILEVLIEDHIDIDSVTSLEFGYILS